MAPTFTDVAETPAHEPDDPVPAGVAPAAEAPPPVAVPPLLEQAAVATSTSPAAETHAASRDERIRVLLAITAISSTVITDTSTCRI
jgi:hypothetical protein